MAAGIERAVAEWERTREPTDEEINAAQEEVAQLCDALEAARAEIYMHAVDKQQAWAEVAELTEQCETYRNAEIRLEREVAELHAVLRYVESYSNDPHIVRQASEALAARDVKEAE
jgi:chromosome segregation ATPase